MINEKKKSLMKFNVRCVSFMGTALVISLMVLITVFVVVVVNDEECDVIDDINELMMIESVVLL